MNARKGREGDVASLVFKHFSGKKCMSFWYSMKGRGIDQLEIYVDYTQKFVGKQSRGWKKAELDISGQDVDVGIYELIYYKNTKKEYEKYFIRQKNWFKVKCLGKLNETLGMFETQKIPHKNETGFNKTEGERRTQ